MLEHCKNYTAKQVIEKIGLRKFQDLVSSGRLEWVKDDTFGNKLYRLKI